MHFFKALLWFVIGALVVFFGIRNWHEATLNLWGDIQVDIKVPVLLAFAFLLGWLPTYLIYRTKLWRARSRLESFERQQAAARIEEVAAPAGPDA